VTSWPFPEDTTLERARKIARSYRALAMAADPTACALLDERATERGQGWVVPRADGLDLDDLLRVPDLAHLVDVPEGTIRSWMSRGELERRTLADGTPVCLLRDVVDLAARKRQRTRRPA
jgi:hypothetical protein